MTKILLVDDHAVVRAGLKFMIEKMVLHTVIDEASDGNSAFDMIRNNKYDLVILDVSMPGTDSLGLLSNILAFRPASRVLMCSMNPEEAYAKKYLQAGAKGYLSKKSSEEEIKHAINTVLNNKRYLSPALTRLLTESALGQNAKNPFDLLSPREFEVVQHLLRGESVAEISGILNLHTSTIGTHKARIYEKLGCKNLVDIQVLAKLHQITPND